MSQPLTSNGLRLPAALSALRCPKRLLAITLGTFVIAAPLTEAEPLQKPQCDAKPRERQPDPSFTKGSLNDLVGEDGVLVISLLRESYRFDHSATQLEKAGIWATEFPAVDAYCLEQKELDAACYPHNDEKLIKDKCLSIGRAGIGCQSEVEQAIAESHRRAWQKAAQRDKEWTAILEEDVVPVRPSRWDAAFKKAWEKVPSHVTLVRLNWCSFPGDYPWATLSHEDYEDVGDFHLSNWTGYNPGHTYNPGGCTSGYLIHKSIIKDVLSLFPCCCALDCCLQHDFIEQPDTEGSVSIGKRPRGLNMMLSMDAWGSTDYAKDFTSFNLYQNGVLVQDQRALRSTREEYETAALERMEDKKWNDDIQNNLIQVPSLLEVIARQ